MSLAIADDGEGVESELEPPAPVQRGCQPAVIPEALPHDEHASRRIPGDGDIGHFRAVRVVP